MKRSPLYFLAAALIAAAVVAAITLQRPSSTVVEPRSPHRPYSAEVQRRLDTLKTFDAKAHAHQAIAARDFRHVTISFAWGPPTTPGIACLAGLTEGRRVFFSDMISEGDGELMRDLPKIADIFNRTLTGHPDYPDKDVCFPVDRQLNVVDITETAREPMRKPKVVDLPTAVRAQNLTEVQRFIASGADVNALDRWQQSPLVWAIRRKNREIMDTLIAAGADVTRDVYPSSALVAAVDTGDLILLSHEIR